MKRFNNILFNALPDKASTEGQTKLRLAHGTPKEFARACIEAIGDISELEARNAVAKYLDEWNKA